MQRSVSKLFIVENTYHDTNQTHKAREDKLRQKAVVIGEFRRKYERLTEWILGGGGVFQHYKY